MKKYLWVIALLAVLVIPAWQIAAQDDTTTTLSLSDALAIVRDIVGTDLVLREVQYDDDESCWKFEFTDLTEICISDTTGEVVENPNDDDSPEATPEVTPDTDDSNDDSSDDDNSNDNSDDDSNDDSNDDSSDDTNDDVIVDTATVTLEEAIAIALTIFPDSTVSKVELQINDHGLLEWEIKLDGDSRSVEVNAETGTVLDFGYDDDDSNDDSSDDSDDNSSDDSNDNDDNSGSSNDDDDDNSDDSNDDSDDDSNDDDNSDDSDDDSDDDNDDHEDDDNSGSSDDESNDD